MVGNNLSQIAGALESTGSVYLINQAGVVVLPGGQVITAGTFVASTRDIADSDFLDGNASFTGTSTGVVVNQGLIVSTNGDVILVGKSVENDGSIAASCGTAGLAAGVVGAALHGGSAPTTPIITCQLFAELDAHNFFPQPAKA